MSSNNYFEDDFSQNYEGEKFNYSGKKLTNATRFINAYNIIDQSLRGIYNYKRNISFADIIRRTVPLNSVVRHYEDKLIDYGRLRNSIVHNSSEDRIIAEPHLDVVKEMEFIASLISSPPKVLDVMKKKDVKILNAKTSILDVVVALSSTGFKRIPIYDNHGLVGVVNSAHIINVLGEVLKENMDLQNYMANTPIRDILRDPEQDAFYIVCSEDITVQEALDLFFKNRKLQAIIITKKGTVAEHPINILTNADFIDLNKIIDDYNI